MLPFRTHLFNYKKLWHVGKSMLALEYLFWIYKRMVPTNAASMLDCYMFWQNLWPPSCM
jgi:hypothetical protein